MRKALGLIRLLIPTFAFGSPVDLRSRLGAIAARLPALRQQLDQRRAAGQDVAYPLVTFTVLENFTRYCKDDLSVSVPTGWGLTAVNGSAATYEPIRDAHAGAWAARILNQTRQKPNIYGLFENSSVITLKAGDAYTLSLWARSDDPGIVTIPINAAWTERLALPATKGKWQRFSRTFTPAQADCSFKLRVLSESVTRGIDIDDVCLVAGDKSETGKNLIANGDFETSWSAQRVARELPDMEKMVNRLARELADTKDFPRVPRWYGDT